MAVGGRGHSEWLWREDDLTGLSLGFCPKWNCGATLAHSVPEKLNLLFVLARLLHRHRKPTSGSSVLF